MTNHPNRSKQVTIHYWDAASESYVTHYGATVVRSGASYGPGPEYAILYRLADGSYLGGVRHQDRGDLMTDIHYAATRRGAMPTQWR